MKSIGVDIGGTQLRAAIFDENHNIIDIFKTNNDLALTGEQNMDKIIAFILDKGQDCKGIGIGCPGPLDAKTGRLLTPPNLFGWDYFEIVKYVEERTSLKAYLNNDGNVAGLAEALLGAGVGYESVAFVGVSTGVGGGYVHHGKLFSGAHTNAAEFWNMIVNEDPHWHKNANPGSLNEQSSGSGFTRFARERYGRPVKPKELFDMFYAGDKIATEIIEHAADTLAKGIANITCTLDPEVIVIGGSVAIYNPIFVDMASERAKRYMIAPEYLNIKLAKFGDDVGLIGASLLVDQLG